MKIFESGGALITRPSRVLWRKLACGMAVTMAAVTVSPVLAVYMLLVG